MTVRDLGAPKDETFKDMNLISLRKYACPAANKTNEWYLKCIDCEKNDYCATGKRVLDILNAQTKPDGKTPVDKFNERMEKYMKRTLSDETINKLSESAYKAGALASEKARNSITKALLNSAPEERFRTYLTSFFGPESPFQSTVYSRVWTWIKRYPDLVESCGLNDIHDKVKTLIRIAHPITVADALKYLDESSENQERHIVDSGNDTDGDEISIDDFLNENIKEKKEDLVQDVNDSAYKMYDSFGLVIHDKCRELVAEKDMLLKQISEIEAKIKSLNETAKIFGIELRVNGKPCE